jgi:hypothetical protein
LKGRDRKILYPLEEKDSKILPPREGEES